MHLNPMHEPNLTQTQPDSTLEAPRARREGARPWPVTMQNHPPLAKPPTQNHGRVGRGFVAGKLYRATVEPLQNRDTTEGTLQRRGDGQIPRKHGYLCP